MVICYGKRKQEFERLLDVSLYPVFSNVYLSQNKKVVLLPFFGLGNMSDSHIDRLLEIGLLL